MARALRIQRPGATYHITARGNQRQSIFDDDIDREHFLALLCQASRRYGFIITAFVANAIVRDDFHGLRITPNVYTTLEEVDTFAAAMEGFIKSGLPAATA